MLHWHLKKTKNTQTKKTWLSFEALSGKIELHRTNVWEKKVKLYCYLHEEKEGGKKEENGKNKE